MLYNVIMGTGNRINNITITFLILLAASLVCIALDPLSSSDSHVPLIFILAELFISMTTQGYLYGIVSSAVSVFLVNIVFTYPYMKVDFSLTGYPLTFFCMFGVSITVCTLSKKVRENQKEKVRANLLRAISHDIRTPLTAILGSISAVKEGGSELDVNTRNKLLSEAEEEAHWLIGVVENLLSITNIETSPKGQLHTEDLPVEEVLASSISKFSHQYPEFKVEVNMPNYPVMATMDAILIEQVLLNILQNSAKHGETADKAIISITNSDTHVRFTIEDNGIGFSRNERIISDSSKNIGIGLSVCSTIISSHGGSVKTYNSKNGGAVVSFTLPVKKLKTDSKEINGNQ